MAAIDSVDLLNALVLLDLFEDVVGGAAELRLAHEIRRQRILRVTQ